MFKEPKWIKDTKIARKMHGEILDSKPGEILVMRPAKVSEYDNHKEHIEAHVELLSEKGIKTNVNMVESIMDHITSHQEALYRVVMTNANAFGAHNIVNTSKKPK